MKKRLLSILICLCLIVGLFPVSALAADAPMQVGEVYQLDSAEDLVWFAEQVNAGTGTAYNAVLLNDIDMTGVTEWAAIGGGQYNYTGTFDGGGHSIKNWTLAATDTQFVGLFGKVTGTIKNLTLDDSCSVSVTVTENFGTNIWIASMICVTREGSIIENCHNKANYLVNAVGSTANSAITACVGGVLGQHSGQAINCTNSAEINVTYGNANDTKTGSMIAAGVASRNYNGDMTGCINTGKVVVNTTGDVKQLTTYAGGVIGLGNYTDGSGTISSCSNSGTITMNVTAADDKISGRLSAYAGGIVANNNCLTDDCVNTGTVNVYTMNLSGMYVYAGGLFGICSANEVKDCTNLASVTVSGANNGGGNTLSAEWHIGGIAGRDSSDTLSKCINQGAVTATLPKGVGGVTVSLEVGGIVGSKNGGLLEDCINQGVVSADSSKSSEKPSAYVGGVVGSINAATAERCENTVSVSLKIADSASGRVGGVAGFAEASSLLNCKNSGSVYGESNKGGNFYVGGIAGYNYTADKIEDNGHAAIIEGAYNSGSVTAKGSTAYIGGIAGYNDNFLSDRRLAYIINSENDGAVTANMNTNTAYRAGGIAGVSSGQIYNSRNSAVVAGTSYNKAYGGGIAGAQETEGAIVNCYSSGTITAGNAMPFLGLLWGSVSYSYALDDTAPTAANYICCDVFGADMMVSYNGASEKITLLEALNAKAQESINETYEWKRWEIKSGVNNGYPVLGVLFSEGNPEAEYQTEINGEWHIASLAKALREVYDGGTIRLLMNIDMTETLTIAKDVTITSKEESSPKMLTNTTEGHSALFYIRSGSITLDNIILDGGYKSDGTGVTSNEALIMITGFCELYIKNGTEIRNNYNTSKTQANISASCAGGINLFERCTVIMDGGKIYGNYSDVAGGVVINDGAHFILSDGEIRNNTAYLGSNNKGHGGGVYVHKGAFTMYDGSIADNVAEGNGGGIYQVQNRIISGSDGFEFTGGSDVEIAGGEITGNAAVEGAGIYIGVSQRFLMEGESVNFGTTKLSNVKITGNTASGSGGGLSVLASDLVSVSGSVIISGNSSTADDNTADVLLKNFDRETTTLPNGKTYGGYDLTARFVIESALSNDTEIRVDTAFKRADKTADKQLVAIGTATYTITESDFRKFVCTNHDYDLILEGNSIYLVARIAATAISLSEDTLSMKVGETETLTATITPDSATVPVIWTSSDPDVATVENGVVTALKPGTVTITATAGDVSATCSVTVTADSPTVVPPVIIAPPIPDDDEDDGNVPDAFTREHYAYIVGYDEDLVHPEENITRAEVAAIFFRLLNEETRNQYLTKENSFSDVNEGDWYNTAVSTMAAMGIISGRSSDFYDANAPITRAELAAIAARFDPNGDATAADFTDISGHWAEKEINIAANNGWVKGYAGKYRPDDYITRAEAMTLVNGVLNRNPRSVGDLLPGMTVWADNMDATKWYYLAVQEATNSHNYGRYADGSEYWTSLKDAPDWAELEK